MNLLLLLLFTHIQVMAIWRDFHYQWLYHRFQEVAQHEGRDFIFYFAIQFTEKAFRSGGLATKNMHNYLDQILPRNGYYANMVRTLERSSLQNVAILL